MSGLSREQATRLLDALDAVQAELDRLRVGLRRLLDGSREPSASTALKAPVCDQPPERSG